MRRFLPLWPLLFLTAAFGQSFDAGVKLGVPATEFFETGVNGGLHGSAQYSSGTRRYTFGLSAELRLTHAFGLELDAMYHRLGYTGTVTQVDASHFSHAVLHVSGNAWDFPLLVQYRFAKYRFGRLIRPYAAAGGTLRYIGPVHGQGQQTTVAIPADIATTLDNDSPADLNKRVYSGPTAALAMELGAGRLHLLPELRYTRWTSNISGPSGVLRLAPSQVEVLLGLSF